MNVVIVGGGIGGLSAAVALRFKNIDVQVFEQAPELTEVGASLQLGPNAVRLLAAFGLLTSLRAEGVRPDAVELVRWQDGAVLLHTDLGEAAEEHFGAPELDFHRADLQRLLFEALPRGVVRLGARVVGVDQDAAGVNVRLADGSDVRADLAVAADGMRSPTRQQLAGADDPVFSGSVVYRGVVERNEIAGLHPDRLNLYWLGPRRHGVAYWIARGRLLAVNCSVLDAEWAAESWTTAVSADEAVPFFDGWDETLVKRIRLTRTMLRGAVFVRQQLPHWSFGRVTLLGDAAHAMEPFEAQGAAQAVEDAYVLAECVAAKPGDLPGALIHYETIRMGRGHALQQSSAAAANDFYLPDGPEQRARDAHLAVLHGTFPWGLRQPIWEYDVRDALSDAVV